MVLPLTPKGNAPIPKITVLGTKEDRENNGSNTIMSESVDWIGVVEIRVNWRNEFSCTVTWLTDNSVKVLGNTPVMLNEH